MLLRRAAAEATRDRAYSSLPLQDVSASEFYGEGYADSDRRMPRIDKALRLLGWDPRESLDSILKRAPEHAFSIHAARPAPAAAG